MSIFLITDWHLKPVGQGFSMIVVMKRKITSEIMTTYFPSFLLIMITYATTFFKSFFFEASLSVNLTTMLVMTTIFISKMEGLPPTSNIRMIDIWLVLCQMVPFAEVVLLTAMEYHRKDGQNEKILTTVENFKEDEPEGKGCKRRWMPQLKTLGGIDDDINIQHVDIEQMGINMFIQ